MGENPLSAIIVVSLLLRALMFMYTMEHDAHRSTWENFLAFLRASMRTQSTAGNFTARKLIKKINTVQCELHGSQGHAYRTWWDSHGLEFTCG